MIHQQPSFQVNGAFSDEQSAKYLESIRMTNRAFVENLRKDHSLKMLSTTFMDYALVSKLDYFTDCEPTN